MAEYFIILKEKFEILKEIPKQNIRFYHMRSIRNFIFHFNEIKSPNDKLYVFNYIDGYLDFVIENGIYDIHECRDLFIKYIYPVGKFYMRNLKFSGFIKWYVIVLYILIMYAILTFFSAGIVFMILGYGIISFFTIEMVVKVLQKRIYGFSW